jgi:hypothetical protein
MEQEAGKIFDPELFAAFRSLITGCKPMSDGRFPIFGDPSGAASAA